MITIQVGQAGNQLGETFHQEMFSTLPKLHSSMPVSDYVNLRNERDFVFVANEAFDAEEEFAQRKQGFHLTNKKSPKRVARTVLVDMEPRVIDACLASKKPWTYDRNAVVTYEGGSGNNWAQGFCEHGPRIRNNFIEHVRKFAEEMDRFTGCAIFQSVGGGTGSGVGAYLSETIRDAFPASSNASIVVWPYSSGEVVVQNYNTVFCMSHLSHSADAVVCMFNDNANEICRKRLSMEKPELTDLNGIFASDLACSLFSPSVSRDPACLYESPLHILCNELCGRHPDYMLTTCSSVPHMQPNARAFASNTYIGLWKQVATKTHKPGVLNSIVTLRGKGSYAYLLQEYEQIERSFVNAAISSMTPVVNVRYHEGYSTEKGIGMALNSKDIVPPLDVVAGKFHRMFSSGAFVHQYEQYGFSKDDMRHSLDTIEKLIHDYNKL